MAANSKGGLFHQIKPLKDLKPFNIKTFMNWHKQTIKFINK
jgi:hypothetical protein